ncbi:5-(carboxyamino)imidazole ribonucleotide mutase [Candidatus Izimaplasma bacterium ZiA1]|uniref:5-(carboxyamino)imidazole ribonucleotide mutase n=1 Tax=Candidatus Izimoplasma sp. ZiA1 TaxID=2024899 RepID=UPI000BAA7B0C|nr:5-(carboxyamino)imidazole ribonucleotide mutase [Candidatus Izimaplasma bacterium ZiA1]
MKKIGIIMGSKSDWEVMKEACIILEEFEISYSRDVVSAHRTPELLFDYAKSAKSRGLEVIIAGAGGAAHLPGMVASLTTLPVIGVPIKSSKLNGLDSLLSIVQMPGGIPVGTMAIDQAKNAALYAISILSIYDEEIAIKLSEYRENQTQKVFDDRKLSL